MFTDTFPQCMIADGSVNYVQSKLLHVMGGAYPKGKTLSLAFKTKFSFFLSLFPRRFPQAVKMVSNPCYDPIIPWYWTALLWKYVPVSGIGKDGV